MQVVSAPLVKGKKVLLRYDIDVPLECKAESEKCKVSEDFRLRAGFSTLQFCLREASQVILMGHIGRPDNIVVPELSVEPIYDWLVAQGLGSDLESGKLKLLENLRFEAGEDAADMDYAKQLAQFGDVFINEAFAAHHKAASTTVLPTLMPHAAGLNFYKEVEKLKEIRENPKKPMVAIIGGIKVEDKLPAIKVLASVADFVLVGGKVAKEFRVRSDELKFENVMIAGLTADELDISEETIEAWKNVITEAKMIVWNGPLGKMDNEGSTKGTQEIAELLIKSNAETIIGGGDTVSALDHWGMLDKFTFVSTGGGAMLEFLEKGTLLTIDALE